jgi:hypothetical protein
MSKSCVICAAYPGHCGSHYSARDVTTRLFALRVRPSGDRHWTVLPGCTSVAGRPIMATAHMPDTPEAVPVGPCWLCEQTADFREDQEAAAAAAVAVTAPVTEGAAGEARETAAGAEPESQPARPAPSAPEADPAGVLYAPVLHQKGESVRADGTKGYLHWLPGGLEADIRADTNGNGFGAPAVETLKTALRDFHPPENTRVTLTETLGTGQAWISVATAPGAQGSLLVCLGQIMERLVAGGVYGEVAVNA